MSGKKYKLKYQYVKEFGDWLKAQRESKGMYQQDVAKASGLSRSTVAMVENDGFIPRQEQLEKIIAGIGMNEDAAAMTLLRAGYFPEIIKKRLQQHPEGLGRILFRLAVDHVSYSQAVRLIMPRKQQEQQAADALNLLVLWRDEREAKASGPYWEKFSRALHNMQVAVKAGDHNNVMEYWRQSEYWKWRLLEAQKKA